MTTDRNLERIAQALLQDDPTLRLDARQHPGNSSVGGGMWIALGEARQRIEDAVQRALRRLEGDWLD